MKKVVCSLLALSLAANIISCSESADGIDTAVIDTAGIDTAKLDAYFEALEQNNRFMGSVAISRDNKLLYAKSVGFADVAQQREANENSKYRIGSISKTFTTVLVFKAIEENLLALDETIDTFFPTIENADKIKISHLLQHRSGIADYFTAYSAFEAWVREPQTEEEMVERIAQGGSDFEPDTHASYSNSNFLLLTYILEKVYESPYASILQEKIVHPIGLKNTYLGKEVNTEDNECHSYNGYWGVWEAEPEEDISISLGAGGVVSTPVDLTQFVEALFSGKLISTNSLEHMTSIREGYGMGLFQTFVAGETGYFHSGSMDSFNALFFYFPDSKLSIALSANGIDYAFEPIALAVLSAVYGLPFEIPEFKLYEPADEVLDAYVGVYSSAQAPIAITITKEDGQLVVELMGMGFPLEATEKGTFERVLKGSAFIVLEFHSAEQTALLSVDLDGEVLLFRREE